MPYATINPRARAIFHDGIYHVDELWKFLRTFEKENLGYVAGRQAVHDALNELVTSHGIHPSLADRIPDGDLVVAAFWGFDSTVERIRQLTEIRDKANDKAPPSGGGRGNNEQDDNWRSFNDSHLALSVLRGKLKNYLLNDGNSYTRTELESKLGLTWS